MHDVIWSHAQRINNLEDRWIMILVQIIIRGHDDGMHIFSPKTIYLRSRVYTGTAPQRYYYVAVIVCLSVTPLGERMSSTLEFVALNSALLSGLFGTANTASSDSAV